MSAANSSASSTDISGATGRKKHTRCSPRSAREATINLKLSMLCSLTRRIASINEFAGIITALLLDPRSRRIALAIPAAERQRSHAVVVVTPAAAISELINARYDADSKHEALNSCGLA